LDDWDKELRSLMEDLDFDNELLDGQIEDNEVLWDVIEEIDDTSRADIQQEVCPVKMMLLKLRKILVLIHRSLTLLLPAWGRAVEAVRLKVKKLPRDVCTRWNSTFRMLDVAIQDHKAIEWMT
ncbi:hypothetical protein FOMPIDRAFT_1106820, partial [Fomitopsis schrenkii]